MLNCTLPTTAGFDRIVLSETWVDASPDGDQFRGSEDTALVVANTGPTATVVAVDGVPSLTVQPGEAAPLHVGDGLRAIQCSPHAGVRFPGILYFS